MQLDLKRRRTNAFPACCPPLARAQDGDLELGTEDHPGATFVLTLPSA